MHKLAYAEFPNVIAERSSYAHDASDAMFRETEIIVTFGITERTKAPLCYAKFHSDRAIFEALWPQNTKNSQSWELIHLACYPCSAGQKIAKSSTK